MLADFAAERGHGAEKGTGKSPSFFLTEFIPIPPFLISAGIFHYVCKKGGRGIPIACDLLPPTYFPAIL